MLVNATKIKQLRKSRNWTQQHLVEVCDLSMRTIQRVEKDGVASHETVAAYCAIFELESTALTISSEEFETNGEPRAKQNLFAGLIFAGGFAAGVGSVLFLL
jgi:transcriptional regulator with XRE-family HTH domain